jgi:hypothetical protein
MAVNGLIAVLMAYLLVAYFVAPEIWIFRYAGLVADFGQMVTTTEQDIPGDPINVGLVGSKEAVIPAFAAAGWNPADKITLRSSVDLGSSVVLDRPISMRRLARCYSVERWPSASTGRNQGQLRRCLCGVRFIQPSLRSLPLETKRCVKPSARLGWVAKIISPFRRYPVCNCRVAN